MSLVAYAASSDEESESEEDNTGTQVQLLQTTTKPVEVKAKAINGHISDEDDDFIPQEVSLQELRPPSGRLTLALPKPKVAANVKDADEEEQQPDEQVTQAFAKLPMPRTVRKTAAIPEEADDEFLHKKAVPAAGSTALEKPPAAVKGRVKISIPSLRDFADVDKEQAEKQQQQGRQQHGKSSKGCGLLSILPLAKSERVFAKKSEPLTAQENQGAAVPSKPVAPAFVPDTVKLRRAAHNTEGVDGLGRKQQPGKQTKSLPNPMPTVSDSEEDDDQDEDADVGDFFSLNSEQQLPSVSSNEINALVAKRAAKMVEASQKFLADQEKEQEHEEAAAQQKVAELQLAQKRYHEQHLNTEAMDALVGKNAKRRRKEAQEMQLIDISGAQVMPDREEWMRTALASTTAFQATGVLTDEEPVAGTRRKHQITYLAHKAKANEAELQAMWSANRQTRRATQNKYGF
ncbi:proline-rich protein PRCC [Drosophila grimshawi]|uniref:GH15518 n=1 Tax=Drosophila grimshawi TaxID=7222 RepID=B4J1X2_DROGR|nr:proline-rich protein PRCC [Drosophila grimshawi]EDV95897.1 GH15518 [Drosophila grimshawi]